MASITKVVLITTCIFASACSTVATEGLSDATSDQKMSTAEFNNSFVGKKMKWTHKSGVGGMTIHNSDGSMSYDTNGQNRNARWTLNNDEFCVNEGEADEACMTLLVTENGFVSSDGSFSYTVEE